eukprot:768551-Hanusia_phi.AAC.3
MDCRYKQRNAPWPQRNAPWPHPVAVPAIDRLTTVAISPLHPSPIVTRLTAEKTLFHCSRYVPSVAPCLLEQIVAPKTGSVTFSVAYRYI